LSSDSLTQFTVASRDATVPFETTLNSVRAAIAATPGARMVDIDKKNGVAVVELPGDRVAAIRGALGDGYLIDPNAPLTY
jgi:hypothetical protein